jgi:energy-coupling factor transporter transmembrane protein EcfT
VVFTLPFFCLSRLKSIWILHYAPVKLLRKFKRCFLVLGILYLCFKSLGLDITPVLLNPFKMAATYLFFVISFYQRIVRTVDSRVIHFGSKKFSQFQQIFLLNWKLARIGLDLFDFYIEDILTKLFQFIDWH